MKIDSKNNIASHSDWFAQFTDLFMEQPRRFELVVRQHWRQHLLRCEIRSERKVLAKLSDRELKDVGIGRASAIIESQRRFRDVPESRGTF